MSEFQPVTPMSGNNVPAKELEIKKTPARSKNKKNLYLILILLAIVFFISGIFLGIHFSKKGLIAPTPTPFIEKSTPAPKATATPQPTVVPGEMESKINSFEKKLKEADLKEEDLIPPALDFDLRFKE